MRRRFLIGLLMFGLAIAAVAQSLKPASRGFDFTYVVKIAPPAGSHEMRVWVPIPASDQFQTITGLQLQTPSKFESYKDLRYGDNYAFFTVNAAQHSEPFEVRLTFHALRNERRVDLVHAVDPPGAFPPDVQPYLQPDKLVPTDGVIADISKTQTAGIADPMQKARKIYEYVISTMHYDHDGTGWGRGDAVWACDSKHGNCTDFHSVFIGMARAAGIPARFEIGFPLPDGQTSGAISGYHCWAEFYLNGVGWIPVDASQAWQYPAKHDYFFGAIDVNRVMFSMGRDIPVRPAPAAGPLNFMVYPYVEIDGKPFTDYTKEFSFRDSAGDRP